MMRQKMLILFLFLITVSYKAQDSSQTFLSLKPTGVEDFLQKHPTYDGRGTIIIILDTGIDIGIDGLIKTSTDEIKAIDVQDFTGQGDVKLFEVKIDKKDGEIFAVNKEDKNLKLKGIDKLVFKSVDEKFFMGNFDEKRLRNSNSHVKDVNGNGKEDDNFLILVFKTKIQDKETWVSFVDTDADGDLSDENPVQSYKDNLDIFKIENPEKPPYLTFALNIFPENKLVNVFFDDGNHGTHVAGIAAGYKIGENDFNGVAIGANLIGLKIGENTLSGGATVTESMKKAFLYADSISKVYKQPCIINMSYGIGSVIEGSAGMEIFLAKLLSNNPYLYVCTSNGNNGPGISSAGLPASSPYVFSSGAVLTKEVGRDLYGSSIKEDIILHFSSRGGEAKKPDVVAPGAAVSTVANWAGFDRYWGTSMASPYTAGVMSLLLSYVDQKHPGVKIPSQLLYRIVKNSSVPMDGYNILDYGGGYINVNNAFEALQKAIKNKEYNNFEYYKIYGYAPNQPRDFSENIYIRNGLAIDSTDVFNFIVRREKTSQENFYRMYELKTDSDWLLPVQKKTYMRNSQGTNVSVKFDTKKLKEPGLYTSSIKAYKAGNNNLPEFDLWATVVIPYEFNASNNYVLKFENEKIMPAMHKRYFVNVPFGTTSLMIKLSSQKDKYVEANYRLFNPDGENIYSSSILAPDADENIVWDNHFDLTAGVYEIVVHGSFLAKGESTYDLTIEPIGVNSTDGRIVLSEGMNKLNLQNIFDKKEAYSVEGEVLGIKKEFSVNIKGDGRHEYPFTLNKNEKSKTFEVELSKEDFNKTTDLAIMIFDTKGNALEKDGLSYAKGSITIKNNYDDAESTDLIFVIWPAFTNLDDAADIKVTEISEMKDTQKVDVSYYGRNSVSFYPSAIKELNVKVDKLNFENPNDSVPYGKLYFKSARKDRVELELPFILK